MGHYPIGGLHHHLWLECVCMGRHVVFIDVQRRTCHVYTRLQQPYFTSSDLDRNRFLDFECLILCDWLWPRSLEIAGLLSLVFLAPWCIRECQRERYQFFCEIPRKLVFQGHQWACSQFSIIKADNQTIDRYTALWKMDTVVWGNMLNTIFQFCFAACMWAMNRFNLPPWTTGLFVGLACVAAGIPGTTMWLEKGSMEKASEHPGALLVVMKGSFPLPSVASGCKYVSMNLVL